MLCVFCLFLLFVTGFPLRLVVMHDDGQFVQHTQSSITANVHIMRHPTGCTHYEAPYR